MGNYAFEDYPVSYVYEEDTPYDYISPMSDFGFKNFFANGKDSKDNLIILLNAILHDYLGFEKITDLSLNPTEDKAENPDRKTTFYDIHCTTSSGKKLIVEMQNKYEDNFRNRVFFYGVEAVMQQDFRKKKKSAVWNFELVPVVTIALCNFHLPGFNERPLAYFNLRDTYTNKEYGNQFQMVFIHMTEFTRDPEKCNTELEKIVFSLMNMDKIQRMQTIPFSNEEGDFYSRLATKSRVSALSRDEKEYYDRWLKHEYDRYLQEELAKQNAHKEGRAKGIEEGELKKAWESARIMKEKGLDIEFIAEVTGLSIPELKKNL